MKATVDRREFANALSAISPAIPPRPNIPVLAMVHITVANNTVTLRGTNYELTISRSLDAADSTPGEALVSFAKIRDLATKFTSADIHLELLDDGLHMKSGRGSYRLACIPVDEYPLTAELPPKVGATTADALAQASKTVTHGADDGADKGIAGVILDHEDGDLWAVATDRYRLAATPVAYRGEPFVCRILHSALNAVVKNMAGDVDIHFGTTTIVFACEDATVAVQCLAEDPVKWRAISKLDDSIDSYVFVTDKLADALERACLVLERAQPARVTISNEQASITAHDDNTTGEELVDVEGASESMFGVNPHYLRELLSCVGADKIRLAPAEARRPLSVVGLHDGQPSRSFHILMPVRLPESL